MDPLPPEPEITDPAARRARLIIVVLTAVFIIAPLVVYVLVGRGAVPRP
jgi:hypothetical protein